MINEDTNRNQLIRFNRTLPAIKDLIHCSTIAAIHLNLSYVHEEKALNEAQKLHYKSYFNARLKATKDEFLIQYITTASRVRMRHKAEN